MTIEPVRLTTHENTNKTLKVLFADPLAVRIERALIHQAFAIPGAGTETTLSHARIPGLKMVMHPMYGLVCELKSKLWLIPHANVIVGYE